MNRYRFWVRVADGSEKYITIEDEDLFAAYADLEEWFIVNHQNHEWNLISVMKNPKQINPAATG